MAKIIEKALEGYTQDPVTRKIERVAAYVKVSSQEQKLHGLSLDAQKMKLTDYAESHLMKIVGWYVDEGVSGRKLIRNRPELQRMIQDAEKGEFDRIRSAEIEEEVPRLKKDKVAEIQEEIDRLNYMWQKNRIKVEKYDRDYDALMARLEEAQAEAEEVVKHDFSKAEAALAGDWRTIYDALDDAHKRAFWRSFIQSIEINRDWAKGNMKIERVNFF